MMHGLEKKDQHYFWSVLSWHDGRFMYLSFYIDLRISQDTASFQSLTLQTRSHSEHNNLNWELKRHPCDTLLPLVNEISAHAFMQPARQPSAHHTIHHCGFNSSESIMSNRIEGDLDICLMQPIECTLVILNQGRDAGGGSNKD